MTMQTILSVARGEQPADLLLKNTRIINVFTGEIISGNIAVAEGRIAGIGDYDAREIHEMDGRYAAPGFIDAHVHIESSMVSAAEFARAVLPLGTTAVAADPHEIANVLGEKGIRYMLDSASGQPMNLFFTLPSCVPATHMETAGAKLEAEHLEPFMDDPNIIALAEMMNYPGVINGDPAVLKKINMAARHKKPVDGHAPGLSDVELNTYLASGVSSDHECTTPEEAYEKMNGGMFIMVREGTGAKDLDALFPAITPKTYQRMMWCTDDRHPHDILDQGHIDYIVRKAIGRGLDPVMAIQMGTLHPARYFGLRDLGAIAPGYRADIIIFPDLDAPRAEEVYSNGVLAAQNGRMQPGIQRPEDIPVPSGMNISPGKVDFSVPALGSKIHVIEVFPGQLVTGRRVADALVSDGCAVAGTKRDLLKIAVVERYSGKGRTGIGFIKGIGLREGALASSVAHDSHNIIVTGADDADMKKALETVAEMDGGMAVVRGGIVRAKLALPIGGLMSDRPIGAVRQDLDTLLRAAGELGTPLHDPFMTLGFMALPVIPELKITDHGLVDVSKFEVISLFAD